MRRIATAAALLSLSVAMFGFASEAQARGRGGREVREIAKQLERATDSLQHEAWHVAGPRERRHAHGLRAVNRLEEVADDFYKSSRRGDPDFRQLRRLEHSFRAAVHGIDGMHRGRRLRGDVRRVRHLIDALDEVVREARYHRHDRHRREGRHDQHARHERRDRHRHRLHIAWR